MNTYSPQSEGKMSTCHEDIQKVFRAVLTVFDHTIECGERGRADQDKAVAEKRSKTPWPRSKHNVVPPKTKSDAVDAMPYPYSWADLEGKNGTAQKLMAMCRCYMFIGYVLGVSDEMYKRKEITAPLRSGSDWDGDKNISEETFVDLPHFERRI